jgi:hydroxyacylglutathione hydrolase
MSEFLKTKLIHDSVWQIEGPLNDLMYLILGDEKAMLLDTGMGIGDLRKTVETLTSLPLIVVNTHGHPDHAGGNGSFAQAWINFKDLEIMKRMCATEFRANDIRRGTQVYGGDTAALLKALIEYKEVELLPYDEGAVFDLGRRKFTAIAIPGHTPGSMGLFDAEERILFSGDSVVTTPAWIYLDHSLPIETYCESLLHLRELTSGVKLFFPGHLPTMTKPDLLDDLIHCSQEILASPGIGKDFATFAGKGLLWSHSKGQIIYDPNKVASVH